jgi:tetratricopeptide (TPR) repeat protein
VIHFNLGIALQGLGRREEAVASYRKAIAIEPGFFEAYGNLGTVLQQQGKLEDAVANYRKALAIQPDALGYFNLGTALRDEGKHDEAGESYLKALALNPNYPDAHNNLGEIFRDKGQMEDAIKCYQNALSINPDHPGANYNMGEYLYLAKKHTEAKPFFEKSRFGDWQERALDCLYRTEQYAEFKEKLHTLVGMGKKSTLLATLSTHYATNFGIENEYNYCKIRWILPITPGSMSLRCRTVRF